MGKKKGVVNMEHCSCEWCEREECLACGGSGGDSEGPWCGCDKVIDLRCEIDALKAECDILKKQRA